jgi:hypothetical protein
MAERPIIFSAPMVRALLEGRKTQTRRLAWRDPHGEGPAGAKASPWQAAKQGDQLWVRETWGCPDADRPGVKGGRKPQAGDRLVFQANPADAYQWQTGHPGCGGFVWRPSIHMPRWASRLTLTVTNVRVQRLHDISDDDAEAEGLWRGKARRHLFWTDAADCRFLEGRPHTEVFAELWNSLHKPPHAWADNPEVAAITFAIEQRAAAPGAISS